MTALRKGLVPAAGALLILLLWQAVSAAGVFSSYVLPPPSKVMETLLRMAVSGELARDVRISLLRVARGFALAFALAFFLGSLRCLFPKSEALYAPFIHFLRHVPPLSLIPLLILWCGIGETTKTVIIVLAAFPPLYLSVVKGFTSCSPVQFLKALSPIFTMLLLTAMVTLVRLVVPSKALSSIPATL